MGKFTYLLFIVLFVANGSNGIYGERGLRFSLRDLKPHVGNVSAIAPPGGPLGGKFPAILGNNTNRMECKAGGNGVNATVSVNGTEAGESKSNTSSIALRAAEDAKAAQDAQAVAGNEARHKAKQYLADLAMESAQMADAAMLGHQAVLDELQDEARFASDKVKEETSETQAEAAIAATGQQGAQHANAEVKMLTDALKAAQAVAIDAEQSFQQTQGDSHKKQQLLEATKNRRNDLIKQLEAARQDMSIVKKAAEKAACAAHALENSVARSKRTLFRLRKSKLHTHDD